MLLDKLPELHRGDLLRVKWLDIYENIGGDPEQAAPAPRTSYGLYWSVKEVEGVTVLVTTTTLDDELEGQNGWCAYPIGTISELKIVRKVRRPRKPRAKKKVVAQSLAPPPLRQLDERAEEE